MVIMGLDQKMLWSSITITHRFKMVDQFHLSMCIQGITLSIKAVSARSWRSGWSRGPGLGN